MAHHEVFRVFHDGLEVLVADTEEVIDHFAEIARVDRNHWEYPYTRIYRDLDLVLWRQTYPANILWELQEQVSNPEKMQRDLERDGMTVETVMRFAMEDFARYRRFEGVLIGHPGYYSEM